MNIEELALEYAEERYPGTEFKKEPWTPIFPSINFSYIEARSVLEWLDKKGLLKLSFLDYEHGT